MNKPLPSFPTGNEFGRQSIPGMNQQAPDRFRRKVAHGDTNFRHKAKNGVYDPITYYHIVSTMLHMIPGQTWRTVDLVEHLRYNRDHMAWDAYTVGRVVTDIADNLNESYDPKPFDRARRWNGMLFHIEHRLSSMVALKRLLLDLYPLAEEVVQQEAMGRAPKRWQSPLLRCPSVMVEVPLQS